MPSQHRESQHTTTRLVRNKHPQGWYPTAAGKCGAWHPSAAQTPCRRSHHSCSHTTQLYTLLLCVNAGSVGMAVWFGFKNLALLNAAILHIGVKSALVVGACSFVVAPAAASFLVPWRELACNAVFVLLSVASAVVPTVLFALFSPELPVVAGGWADGWMVDWQVGAVRGSVGCWGRKEWFWVAVLQLPARLS